MKIHPRKSFTVGYYQGNRLQYYYYTIYFDSKQGKISLVVEKRIDYRIGEVQYEELTLCHMVRIQERPRKTLASSSRTFGMVSGETSSPPTLVSPSP